MSTDMSTTAQTVAGAETTVPHVRQPLIRSCLSCHARRVKCDKARPCSGCVRINAECVYPTGKATRKRRKKQNDAELLGRIKELEDAVDKLGSFATVASKTDSESPRTDDHASPVSDLAPGRATLVVGKDTSQYLNGSFWVKMSEEIADLKDAMRADSEGEVTDEDETSIAAMNPSMHSAFIFGNSHMSGLWLKQLRPDPKTIPTIWQAFQTNIDTILKICHRPTIEKLMYSAIANPDGLSKPAEALFFSVCFGAVNSMDDAECRKVFGAEKKVMVKQFRIGTEQALARANFLSNSSLTSLSAFATYNMILRCLDESKTVWALSSLASQLAQSVGLHRDGTQFGLKPFDTEMRRRLWWFIWAQNRRSREDHGLNPNTVTEAENDTKIPLNVNDEDLYPDMTDFPPSREGFTEIFSTRFRVEMTVKHQTLTSRRDASGKLLEPDVIYQEMCTWMNDNYMRHCDLRDPSQFIVYSIAKLMLLKGWLSLALPGSLHAATSAASADPAQSERIFERAVEACEIWVGIISHREAKRWNWFAPAFVQWQLVCYMLAEIPKRMDDALTQRAWAAIAAAWALPHVRPEESQSSVLWKALAVLWERAVAHRKALEAQRLAHEEKKLRDVDERLRGMRTASGSAASTAVQSVNSMPSANGIPSSTGALSSNGSLPASVQPTPQTFLPEPDYMLGYGLPPSAPLDFTTDTDWGAIGAIDPTDAGGLWGDWTQPQQSSTNLGEWDDIVMTGNFMSNENLW